jgi:hypothetical protein
VPFRRGPAAGCPRLALATRVARSRRSPAAIAMYLCSAEAVIGAGVSPLGIKIGYQHMPTNPVSTQRERQTAQFKLLCAT